MYDLIVKYVETGDPTFLEKAAREALRSGAFLEHVLDLILITPVEKLPPSPGGWRPALNISCQRPTVAPYPSGWRCLAKSLREG